MPPELKTDLSPGLVKALFEPIQPKDDDEEDKALANGEDHDDSDPEGSEQEISDAAEDQDPDGADQGDEGNNDLEDGDSSEEGDDEDQYDYEEEEGADDDSRDTSHEVMVDGTLHHVTLEELKASYSGGKAVQARLQEATETRKSAHNEAQQAYAARQQYAKKLADLDQILQSVTPQEPDWNTLQADPEQYNLARMNWDDTQRKRQAIAQEHASTQQEIQSNNKTAMDRHLAGERVRVLTAIPELANEQRAAEIGVKWFETLEHYGFTREEFADVSDHRLLRVINDLTKANAALNARSETKERRVKRRRKVKTSVRPNSRTAHTRADERQRRTEAVTKKARQSGNVDDIARTLLVERNP